MKKEYFKYNNGEGIIPKDAISVSASGISNFFDNTSNWYRENLLNEEGFKGNTFSELGTIVHAAAAMYADTRQVDTYALSDYIESLREKQDINIKVILDQYKPMIETLVNDFLKLNVPEQNEEFIWKEILPGIVIRGTCDAYNQGVVRDYKTTGIKTSFKFSRQYWFQLMTYAWLYNSIGKEVHTLELVYVTRNEVGRVSEKTGKLMKDYPSKVEIVNHNVTPDDMKLIDGCINLIADSLSLWKEKPELRYILMQDYRYKTIKSRLFG